MQTDLKRLIAYSSISHIGVIMLAIFSLTTIGISGASIQMVSHTITTGALFIILAVPVRPARDLSRSPTTAA